MALSRQVEKILAGKHWKFFGGIHPASMKNSSSDAIEELRIPALITLPLDRHLGKNGVILVNVGDTVKRGQQLTVPDGQHLVPLHATTSGTILSIAPQVLPHPSGFLGMCITIKPDGLDEAVEAKPMTNWMTAKPEELLERIREFGVEGLGGALFQTASKLRSVLHNSTRGCKVFIVNGCECEPVVSCDNRVMIEQAREIVEGIKVIQKIIEPEVTLIAIEENKHEAIKVMKEACSGTAIVRVLPDKYPSGAARNIIKITTGIEIPYNTHTSESGIVVDNIQTVLAIKNAVIDGLPLISRVITVAGGSLGRTGNVRVRLGTSARFILNNFKLNPEFHQRMILGGPMMGFTLPSIDVPITKGVNCLLAPNIKDMPVKPAENPCIRCGRCARACPSRLVPYQIYAQSKASNHSASRKCGIADCTLCGCCSFVCPSKINLTAQFRREKAIQKLISDIERRNEIARERMALHEQRILEEEKKRNAKKAAALARIKAQQEAEAKLSPEERESRKQAMLQAAKEKAKLKKQALLQSDNIKECTNNTVSSEENTDDKNTNGNTAMNITSATTSLGSDLPFSLRRSALRKTAMEIKSWQSPVELKSDLSMIGLERSDLEDPQPAKIRSIYDSPEEKTEIERIPEVLKKRSLRTRR